MPLVNCEINLILTQSNRCFIIDNSVDDQEPIFTITDTKLYIPIVTLSIQDNAKLLEQINQVLREHLTGINMNQKQQQNNKTNIQIS